MALKFISAEEAASLVKDNDNVGFSGFTHAGCPKVVPVAIAAQAKAVETAKAKAPKAEVEAPEAEVEAPKAEVETPEAEAKAPKTEGAE